MKKIILLAMLISFSANAGPGHDHGTSEFENATAGASHFELSHKQIENLNLKTSPVVVEDFYQTISVPMVLKANKAQGFMLESSNLGLIKAGQKVRVALDAMPELKIEGQIESSNLVLDPKTRLYSVYAKLDDNSLKNYVGMKGNMIIDVLKQENTMTIPSSALQGEFGYYYVFVQNGHNFEKVEVVIGKQSDGKVEVVEGLHQGDEVVTMGSYQLKYVTGNPITEEIEEAEECDEDHDHEEHNHEAEEAHGHDDHDHDLEETH